MKLWLEAHDPPMPVLAVTGGRKKYVNLDGDNMQMDIALIITFRSAIGLIRPALNAQAQRPNALD